MKKRNKIFFAFSYDNEAEKEKKEWQALDAMYAGTDTLAHYAIQSTITESFFKLIDFLTSKIYFTFLSNGNVRLHEAEILHMKKIYLLLLLSFLIFCSGGEMKDLSENHLYQSIPDKILGWKASGEDAVYDRKTLFDYMNGGAELYLAYDFNKVFVRRFTGPDKNEIVLDIYDMRSSEEAFGIFSLDHEDEEADIGQGSTYGFGLLRFWKDRYFISITALGDEQKAEPVIRELGKSVEALIKQEGPLPASLSFLPEKNLKKDRTSYFHSNISLNNRFFIASENILNLSNRTNCVFAEYEKESERTANLLLVQYENNVQARAAYESFIRLYMPEAQDSGLAQMENGKWTMAKVEQEWVSVVFESSDKEWAHELQSEIKFNTR